MSKATGGPAFPELGNVGYNSDWQSEGGMTLRDYFAAKAMGGICAHQDVWGLTVPIIAEQAYKLADEMLKARARES